MAGQRSPGVGQFQESSIKEAPYTLAAAAGPEESSKGLPQSAIKRRAGRSLRSIARGIARKDLIEGYKPILLLSLLSNLWAKSIF